MLSDSDGEYDNETSIWHEVASEKDDNSVNGDDAADIHQLTSNTPTPIKQNFRLSDNESELDKEEGRDYFPSPSSLAKTPEKSLSFIEVPLSIQKPLEAFTNDFQRLSEKLQSPGPKSVPSIPPFMKWKLIRKLKSLLTVTALMLSLYLIDLLTNGLLQQSLHDYFLNPISTTESVERKRSEQKLSDSTTVAMKQRVEDGSLNITVISNLVRDVKEEINKQGFVYIESSGRLENHEVTREEEKRGKHADEVNKDATKRDVVVEVDLNGDVIIVKEDQKSIEVSITLIGGTVVESPEEDEATPAIATTRTTNTTTTTTTTTTATNTATIIANPVTTATTAVDEERKAEVESIKDSVAGNEDRNIIDSSSTIIEDQSELTEKTNTIIPATTNPSSPRPSSPSSPSSLFDSWSIIAAFAVAGLGILLVFVSSDRTAAFLGNQNNSNDRDYQRVYLTSPIPQHEAEEYRGDDHPQSSERTNEVFHQQTHHTYTIKQSENLRISPTSTSTTSVSDSDNNNSPFNAREFPDLIHATKGDEGDDSASSHHRVNKTLYQPSMMEAEEEEEERSMGGGRYFLRSSMRKPQHYFLRSERTDEETSVTSDITHNAATRKASQQHQRPRRSAWNSRK